jgi:hypothetical protein
MWAASSHSLPGPAHLGRQTKREPVPSPCENFASVSRGTSSPHPTSVRLRVRFPVTGSSQFRCELAGLDAPQRAALARPLTSRRSQQVRCVLCACYLTNELVMLSAAEHPYRALCAARKGIPRFARNDSPRIYEMGCSVILERPTRVGGVSRLSARSCRSSSLPPSA